MTKTISLATAPAQASDASLRGMVGRDTFLARLARLLVTWQQRAAFRYRLAQLDERDLADMGLPPALAMIEANKPFWRA